MAKNKFMTGIVTTRLFDPCSLKPLFPYVVLMLDGAGMKLGNAENRSGA